MRFTVFKQSQQDAFLPYVEAGHIIFIGATTENPSFESNLAAALPHKGLRPRKLSLLRRSSNSFIAPWPTRNMACLPWQDSASKKLKLPNKFSSASRPLLMATPAPLTTHRNSVFAAQSHHPMASFTSRRNYSKTFSSANYCATTNPAKEHYNLISALHKSVRNSDPDAALYWLARMLESGEDPLYSLVHGTHGQRRYRSGRARRIGHHASCEEAFEFLGAPEGNLALAQAAVYLSLAPKSNALYTAYGGVQEDVQETEADPVPLHLRNAPTGLMKNLGYGKDYQYAHNYQEKVTDMQCLPDNLAGRSWYKPTDQGFEARLRTRLDEIRKIKSRGASSA